MSTLGDMKTRISEETTRDDLLASGAIEREIRSAIRFYSTFRFWFNEKRTQVSFNTVNGQSSYTSADHADIPNLMRIDYVLVEYQGRQISVRYATPEQIEVWTGSISAVLNPPSFYNYYQKELRFYPIPDDAYPVRVAGVIRLPAPADDAETDNAWMVDAEELIRARATRQLYLTNFFGSEQGMVAAFGQMENEALERLRFETSSRSNVRTVRSHNL